MAKPEAGDDEAPKKKSKLPLIIMAVLALGLGGGGAWFFLGKGDPKDEDKVAEEVSKKPKKTSFVNLEPFTFNLLDKDQDRFAKVGVILEVVDPAVEGELKTFEPAIRNALLLLLTSKTSDGLLSVDGKTDLSYEIVDATNAILAGEPAPRIKMPKPKSKKKPTLKFKKKVSARDDDGRRDRSDEDEFERDARGSRDDRDDRDDRDSRRSRDSRDARDDRDDRYARDDDYDRRGRNSRRRGPVIPERVYAAHFSQFLVQ